MKIKIDDREFKVLSIKLDSSRGFIPELGVYTRAIFKLKLQIKHTPENWDYFLKWYRSTADYNNPKSYKRDVVDANQRYLGCWPTVVTAEIDRTISIELSVDHIEKVKNND